MTRKAFAKRVLSAVLCLALIAAMALTFTACQNAETPQTTPQSSAENSEATELGEGAVSFNLQVVDKSGKATDFIVHTNEKTVGAALQQVGLVQGEQGAYGLYVKTVNGITADYDVDKTYWAFYVNGAYAMSGIDTTNIEAGAQYSLKVES